MSDKPTSRKIAVAMLVLSGLMLIMSIAFVVLLAVTILFP